MKIDKNVWKYFGLITQVGISMLSPVVLCIFIGYWLDQKFGWYTTVPLLILGFLAGARNTWKLLSEMTEEERKRKT